MFTKTQVKLLIIFYKSTLLLSVAPSFMLAALSFMQPLYMLCVFGVSFLSAGTAITLFYKESSRHNEYYFFYNMGLSKRILILTCVGGNFIIGAFFISLFIYVQHA